MEEESLEKGKSVPHFRRERAFSGFGEEKGTEIPLNIRLYLTPPVAGPRVFSAHSCR